MIYTDVVLQKSDFVKYPSHLFFWLSLDLNAIAKKFLACSQGANLTKQVSLEDDSIRPPDPVIRIFSMRGPSSSPIQRR